MLGKRDDGASVPAPWSISHVARNEARKLNFNLLPHHADPCRAAAGNNASKPPLNAWVRGKSCRRRQRRNPMEMILIIVLVVLLFGGGGYWGRSRGHW
jgi:hypothetical protein